MALCLGEKKLAFKIYSLFFGFGKIPKSFQIPSRGSTNFPYNIVFAANRHQLSLFILTNDFYGQNVFMMQYGMGQIAWGNKHYLNLTQLISLSESRDLNWNILRHKNPQPHHSLCN
jgi:hypothetical protein